MSPPVPAPHSPSPDRASTAARIRTRIRRRLMAGLVLVLPIWITLLVVGFVFGLMRDASLWVVEALLRSPLGQPLLQTWNIAPAAIHEQGLDALPGSIRWGVATVAIVLTILLLYVLGMVTTNVVGRRAVGLVEALVDRVPLVKTVYRASKQVLETVAGETARPFKRVVLIPFPSPAARSIGFVTRVSHDVTTGEALYSVFVATTPNPTTGFVFVIKASDAVELDWSIEEAVKVVMSGGVLMPAQLDVLGTSAVSEVAPPMPRVPVAPPPRAQQSVAPMPAMPAVASRVVDREPVPAVGYPSVSHKFR